MILPLQTGQWQTMLSLKLRQLSTPSTWQAHTTQNTLTALQQAQTALRQYQYGQVRSVLPQGFHSQNPALQPMVVLWQAKAYRYSGETRQAQALLLNDLTPWDTTQTTPLHPMLAQQWLDIAQSTPTPSCLQDNGCYTMASYLTQHAPPASYASLKGLTTLIQHQKTSPQDKHTYLKKWLQMGGLYHEGLTQQLQATYNLFPWHDKHTASSASLSTDWLIPAPTFALEALGAGNASQRAWQHFTAFQTTLRHGSPLPLLTTAPTPCQAFVQKRQATLWVNTPTQLAHALYTLLWQLGNEVPTCAAWTYPILHNLGIAHANRPIPASILAVAAQAEWEHHRPLLSQPKQWQAFLNYSTWHIARFPHAPMTAGVLFWQGHLRHLQGDTRAARHDYEAVLKTFPYSYFASRAWAYLEGSAQKEAYPRAFITTPVAVDQLPSVSATTASYLATRYHLPSESKAWQALPPETQRRLSAAYLQWVLPEASPLRKSWELAQDTDPTYPHWGMALTALREGLDRLQAEGLTPQATPLTEALSYPLPTSLRPLWMKQHHPWLPLAMAIAKEESSWNPKSVSPVGATGLMQLMPATAQELAQQHGIPLKLTEPDTNIQLGLHYLDTLSRAFHGDAFLMTAAYNAGPGAIQQTLKQCGNAWQYSPDLWQETCLVPETRFYLQKVFRTLWHYRLQSDTLAPLSTTTKPLLPRIVPMDSPEGRKTLQYLEDFTYWHTGELPPFKV
jgi:soluble lytic murein transglycosylase-like protein